MGTYDSYARMRAQGRRDAERRRAMKVNTTNKLVWDSRAKSGSYTTVKEVRVRALYDFEDNDSMVLDSKELGNVQVTCYQIGPRGGMSAGGVSGTFGWTREDWSAIQHAVAEEHRMLELAGFFADQKAS